MNLPVLIKHIERIGEALPPNRYFEKPTLFLRGGSSNYILDEDKDAIVSAFAKAKLITIPKVGHWLHAENPTQFYKEVMMFL